MKENKTLEKTASVEDMRRYSRLQMLEMLVLQSEEIGRLREEVDNLTSQLNDRSFALEKAGSIADMSILINGVLDSIQAAGKDYLYNIEILSKDAETTSKAKIAEAQIKADAILAQASSKAKAMKMEAQGVLDSAVKEAEIKAQAELANIRAQAESMIAQATAERDKIKREADGYWVEISQKLENFYKEHKGLRELISGFGGETR